MNQHRFKIRIWGVEVEEKKRTELLEPEHKWAGTCFQATWWIRSW